MGATGCVLLLLVAAAAAAEKQEPGWNRIIDAVLDLVNEEQMRRDRHEIDLRDVDHAFDKKLGFLRLRGRFTADGGWLRDVSTARRVGDVVSHREGNVVSVAAAVTWDELRIGFRHYLLKVGKDIEGSLEVRVKDNRVRVVFAFNLVDGECKTSLQNLTIEEFSGIEVKITGLRFFDFLAEQIGKWFIERKREDIVSKLESMFKEVIPPYLDDFSCDEYANILDAPL